MKAKYENRTRKTLKSKYHTRKSRKCKYCNREAKRNIQPDQRNKGFYKTCGRKKCLTAQYRDAGVNARKACVSGKVCKHCGTHYRGTSARQKWCKNCCPDKAARARMQRYGISEPEYQNMLLSQNGLCAICKIKFPRCVDHDHNNNKVRKLLCDGCNTKLASVENKLWLERALAYITLFE